MKYLSILMVPVFILACGGEVEEEEVRDGIKITGEISGADGQSVTMWVFEAEGERIVDSSIVENGEFTLWTDTKELREYVIEFGKASPMLQKPMNNLVYLFPDENSGTIMIQGKFPSIGDNYTISGDQNSMDYHDYVAFIIPFYEQRGQLNEQYKTAGSPEVKAELMKQMDSLQKITRAYAVKYIDEQPSSPISWIMLQEFYPPSGMMNFDSTDLGYFEKVSREMKLKYPYSDYPSFVDESIENTLAQIEQLKANPEGDLAPELAYENPEGKVMSLSSLRGKVVLVDFWASWCGPCRQENPNVVKTYNEYKNKGFTVFSVSLDTDKNKWIQAIEADNLSWPNHVSDLKGWQSEAAAIYGVNSIPATFLIDQEGHIIDQNLRGGLLEQRLQEILR